MYNWGPDCDYEFMASIGPIMAQIDTFGDASIIFFLRIRSEWSTQPLLSEELTEIKDLHCLKRTCDSTFYAKEDEEVRKTWHYFAMDTYKNFERLRQKMRLRI